MVKLDEKTKRIAEKWESLSKRFDSKASQEDGELKTTFTSIFGGAAVGGVLLTSMEASPELKAGLIATTALSSFFANFYHSRNEKIYRKASDIAKQKAIDLEEGNIPPEDKYPVRRDVLKLAIAEYSEKSVLDLRFLLELLRLPLL